jgi:hypothetical protein
VSAAMPSPALVSFLGFPGWGPLHLQLAMGGDPEALARRLARARISAGPGAAPGGLLAAFLRQQGDGRPLGEPWGPLPPGCRSGSHRYRIVCGPGRRPGLRVVGWCWCGPAAGWRPCGEVLPLALFLARHGQGRWPRQAPSVGLGAWEEPGQGGDSTVQTRSPELLL